MEEKKRTILSETGSNIASLYGIKSDSYCPINGETCNPKCVFHSARWFDAEVNGDSNPFLRFDGEGKLILNDVSSEDFDVNEDIWRECQIANIVNGLELLFKVRDNGSDLFSLVRDMASHDWSINTYEQNLTRYVND